jgi:transposase
MVDYKEILRLAANLSNSQRQIAASVGSSHHTVKEVLETAKLKGVEWPIDDSVSNEALMSILFPDKYAVVSGYLEPDYEYIHRELAKPGVTMTLLWSEYNEKCLNAGMKPYMTTQFGDKYRRYARITKATMRITHKPGDAMEVDWAGNTLPVYDSVTGETSKAYLFVAVLPCSCYAYAETCTDMTQENWLCCHAHAYSFFGGVTRLLIPDNLKTGVISNTKYETVLNRSYREMAEFYDTAIVPCRVEAPKDKSHAEGSVKFASTWILAALRNEKFFSYEEVAEAVKEKLEELNGRPFTGKNRIGCRCSGYLEEEKAYMKPLPTSPYEPATWIPNVKVGYDYLVSDGINKYSVPFDLIGEKVDMRLTRNTVEVFFRTNRVALHVRSRTIQRDPVVNPEHMTPEHRKYMNYNAEDFTVWANGIGHKTALVVKSFLSGGKEVEQGFKACASLTKMAERYGAERLESVCAKVLTHTATPSIRIISTVLKNGQDKPKETETQPEQDYSNSYGITRGVEYFRKGGASK